MVHIIADVQTQISLQRKDLPQNKNMYPYKPIKVKLCPSAKFM